MSNLEILSAGRVRTLVLAREDALNAFNNELYNTLAEALRDAHNDPTVATVIVTGRGRAFSAGQDMADMANIGEVVQEGVADDTSGEPISGFPGLIDALTEFGKPLIAAVNGLGVGLGFTMLAHCDLVFMADNARLRVPFCPLGVAPEAASSVLFPQVLGWQNAAWVLFSGSWVSAQEAQRMGIAWRLCEPDKLLEEANDVAATIAQWPIPSLMATKSAMIAARAESVRQARQREDAAFTDMIGSPANIEAVTAFLEKRTPDFSAIPGA